MTELESLRFFIMETFQSWGGPPETDRRGSVSITGIMNGGEGTEGSDTEDQKTFDDNTETPNKMGNPSRISYKTVDPSREGRDIGMGD